MTTRTITPQEYDEFRGFLEKACGIVLGDNRHYLVTSRLSRLMADQAIDSFSALVKQANNNRVLKEYILDAMTTNETSWFRDTYPYEILKTELLPELCKHAGMSIRIWSAACSTGQEPYSISMVIQEFLMKNPGVLKKSVEIIATDISSAIIKEAESGVYDGIALVRGLSEERKQRFFRPLPGNAKWEVKKEIRERVKFRTFNLMENYASLGRFDIVFCRNVLIYFSHNLKKDILARIARSLQPGGYLLLGGSETISGYSSEFEMVRGKVGTLYRLI